MNREDIIRMAREAGFATSWTEAAGEALERFAELVRADEREHIAAWMIQRGYSTGHGDTTKDLLDELDWQVVQNWASAMKTGVETEREACAKLVDYWEAREGEHADAIRARSNT